MALALLSTAGCGDDASSSNAPDASALDASTDAMQPIDASQPDADPKEPDAGGRLCGGFAGTVCSDTQYCDYPDDQCGGADGAGTCTPPTPDSRCGCDGREYESECATYQAGEDISAVGTCAAR
jgi:hypothetical protein